MEVNLKASDGTRLTSVRIGEAVTRDALFRGVTPGKVIKVAFLDAAPDYSTASLESYWVTYFPGTPLLSQAELAAQVRLPGSSASIINKQYERAKLIQSTFQPVPSEQRQAILDRAIMRWQDTYANVQFVASDVADADVRVGLSNSISENFAPGAQPGAPRLGDVYLNTSLATGTPSGLFSDQALTTMFHEFGHVLGLSHGDDPGQLPGGYGAMQYEVMGASASVGGPLGLMPVTPMLFDALGLQQLGLLKTNLNIGDTSYSFVDIGSGTRTGRFIIDDGGSRDTIDASGTSTNNDIDLRSADFANGKAYFSSIGMASSSAYNIAIYQGTTIENAIGRRGKDDITGNDADNRLDGRGGKDVLRGGAGADTYVFSDVFGQDTVIDTDGRGSIEIDGSVVGGTAKGDGAGGWSLKTGSQTYNLSVDRKPNGDGRRLTVAKRGDRINTVTIDNFDEAAARAGGYLGIRLEANPRFIIKSGAGANPFTDLDFDPATVSGTADIVAGTGEAFTLNLDQAAKAGDTITLALSALADKFKAVLGDSEVDADGAVITLAEGQTQVSFALVQQGEVTADASGSLKATRSCRPVRARSLPSGCRARPGSCGSGTAGTSAAR